VGSPASWVNLTLGFRPLGARPPTIASACPSGLIEERRENSMRRVAVVILTLLLTAILASPVSASNVHLKGGPNAEPTFTDLGLKLNAQGDLSGLGNENILITITARGLPTASCTNPAGATQPPGQNPAEVVLTGTEPISAGEIKNGTVHFDVTTAAPVSPIAGAPDCPNPQWTEAITDVAFTSAVITVEQPVGTLVLTISCSFSSPTSNGSVPGSNVSCTQS
jgi:hypothetical protein